MKEERRPLSHTQLSMYMDCPQKYAYRYVHGLPREPDSLSMLFSKHCIHPLVENLLLGRDYPDIYSAYMTNGGLNQAPFTPKTLSMVQDALQPLLNSFMEDYTVVNTETPILDPTLNYLCIPDAVLEHTGTGKQIPLNIKMTSAYSTQHLTLPFDDQYLGQTTLIHSNEIIIILIQIHKTGYPVCDIVNIPISTDLQEAWKRGVTQVYKDVQWNAITNTWLKNAPSSCYRFNKPCPYMTHCLGTEYDQKRRDPDAS